jgi:quercetin dioxygenase-like cupin family protein
MIRAYRLYTGPEGNSHVTRGTISSAAPVAAESIQFQETPAHSALHWHNDPVAQYVITLTGVIEFQTKGGDRFTLHPGEVLLALDRKGSGHKWRLVNDQPWVRANVVFREDVDTHFIPDKF